MNTRLAITTLTLLAAAPWSVAQNVTQEPQEDPIQAAIREFNMRDMDKPNEVTVVLAPPLADEAGEAPPTAAVLVTGTAPQGTELIEGQEENLATGKSDEAMASDPNAEEPASKKPQTGLALRVEKIQAGTETIDPAKVKLHAPFPAKPLSPAPTGWHLESSESAPPFTREVELAPGKSITLTVRPHLLVPDTNGSDVFVVSEPGYEPSLAYLQDATVGAILSKSIRQLDDDSKELGAVVDNLQQLLVSLPKPEPAPAPEPEPSRKR